jgi:hypothetical protein
MTAFAAAYRRVVPQWYYPRRVERVERGDDEVGDDDDDDDLEQLRDARLLYRGFKSAGKSYIFKIVSDAPDLPPPAPVARAPPNAACERRLRKLASVNPRHHRRHGAVPLVPPALHTDWKRRGYKKRARYHHHGHY